jgi:DNA-binding NarL/FixJ family response regulator
MSSAIARLVVQHFHERGRFRRETDALSKRELEILELVAKGARNKEIAEQLGIADDTVRAHLRRIYETLRVRSRTEAAMKFRKK